MYVKVIFNYVKKQTLTVAGSVVGAYVALFWVVDGKYNIAISRLESRVTNIVTRLESENWKKAIELVPNLQNRKIPLKPVFVYPKDVFKSLDSSYDDIDLEVIEELQSILVSKKDELNNLNLGNIILTGLDLTKSNFSNSNLLNANLKDSNLSDSRFNYVDATKASFKNTDLTNSEFEGANLTNSNLELSILVRAKLFGTNLTKANLNNTNFSAANLHLSNLSYATLNNSNLSKSNLVGVDFSNANYMDKANFNEAKYNSRSIEIEEISLYKEVVVKICNKIASKIKNNDPLFEDDCHQEVLKNFELSYGPPTKFPEGFDPKAHGMIDINEIIDQIRSKKS